MNVQLEQKAMVPVARRSRWRSMRKKIIMARNYHLSRPQFVGNPDPRYLGRFADSEWGEYGYWLYRNRLFQHRDLERLYETAKFFTEQPLVSIIMPVYNPDPDEIALAIRSVLWQAYPNWELWVIDDGSTKWDYIDRIKAVHDKRFHYVVRTKNAGIAATCQHGLERISGEFVTVLDQDDELYLDALFDFASVIQRSPIDYMYSDRDMLSPGDKRYMHFFKPGWSPEYLLSFNYIQHFEIFRTDLVKEVGGFRQEFNGSQDYDLTLRVTEKTNRIYHHSNVLYSWRQSEKSVARNLDSKAYAYEAGARAVLDATKRRGMPVADVVEDPDLWRGHYRLKWDAEAICAERKVHLFPLGEHPGDGRRLQTMWQEATTELPVTVRSPRDTLMRTVSEAVKELDDEDIVFFCDQAVKGVVSVGLLDMAGFLTVPGVSAVGCKFIDDKELIHNVGLAFSRSGKCLYTYRRRPADDSGYGAICAIPRNVSMVFPSFWGCRVETFKRYIEDVEEKYFPMASMRMQMKMRKQHERIVVVPYNCLRLELGVAAMGIDINAMLRAWNNEGLHDDYYNPNLTDLFEDYGLNATGA